MTKETLINKWLDNLKPMLLEIAGKTEIITKAINQIQNSIDEIKEEEKTILDPKSEIAKKAYEYWKKQFDNYFRDQNIEKKDKK